MGLERISIAKLVRDAGTQVRAKLDDDRVKDYAEILDELPPAKVVYDGTRYILWDGFHTTAAHESKGRKDIAAEVRAGTLRDAILLSLGANADHGIPRTHDDKRRAVQRMLDDEEWAGWSNVAIAKACHVSESLVRTMRPEPQPRLNEVEKGGKRKSLDGKERKLPAKKAKPEKPAAPTQEAPKKSAHTPRVIRDRDGGGDDGCDEGPVDDVPTIRREPEEPRPFVPVLFDGGPDDGKPAPEPPPWEGDDVREQKPVEVSYKQPSAVPPGFAAEAASDAQVAEDAAAEADIRQIEDLCTRFLKTRPKYAARLGQFCMGMMRVANIEAEKGQKR